MLDARSGRSEERVPLEHLDPGSHSDGLGRRSQRTPPPASHGGREPPARRPPKKTMSEDEVVGQAFVFLLAGYETSSNTLSFTCYLLALHPPCQRRVLEEVDDFYTRHVSVAAAGNGSEGARCCCTWTTSSVSGVFLLLQVSPDYTNVQELKYLDMVLSEALRLYPPGFR